jgi:hypothetical protein
MPVADRVLELLDDILGRREADASLLAALVQKHVPESLYHEYKRGQWLTPNSSQDVRAHVSAFANAEGGVLILGIVGGEDSQGTAKWTFEPPACPDPGGDWNAWLGRILSDVATKTRVEWQVVNVNGNAVVLIAANRAQELIRVYEKRSAVCYLRVADNTVPIEQTLYADLALGRRAKPDLTLEALEIGGSTDSGGFHLDVGLVVHNQGLLWVPDVRVVWIGYARTPSVPSPSLVSASLKREIDLRSTIREELAPIVVPCNFWEPSIYGGRWKTGVDDVEIAVKPFELRKFSAQIRGLPVGRTSGSWAWCGAVMILPKNGSPLWAQLLIQGESENVGLRKAWALPSGTPPVVAWFQGDSVLIDLRDAFDSIVVS